LRNSSVIGRAAAIAAVCIAVLAVILIVFSGGSSYTVKADFENASQIVSGDLVEASGNSIGTVSKIALTQNGEAQLTLNISDKAYSPLREGTKATIREVSLSGVANRYVDLELGPATGAAIPSGGTIADTSTTSEVDLDELFDTLDQPTRKGLENLIQGSASQYQGAGQLAQSAFEYLNPSVDAASELFAEINRNTAGFTNFVVKSANLVSDIATRQTDLSALVQNLATTTEALANQHTALGNAIEELPGFMRLANTTFVNLRSALNNLKPLVDASKPVAPKLQKLLVQLRPLANDAVPTVKDLANIISRPGPDNDLIDLVRLSPQLAAVAVDNVNADGKERPGAFPESTIALNDSTPELAYARPYAVDLTGWFEGFSHPGGIDANGGYSRVSAVVGVASLSNGVLDFLPALADAALRKVLAFGGSGSGGLVVSGQGDRCPGSMERGAIYYPESGYACTPSQVPTGS
jgi:phospholipid/cholesterol/gamma-HCH transport system substrate-binding protein